MASDGDGGAPADPPEGCVYRAVVAGVTADELRRVIEDYASGGTRTRRSYYERRAAALSYRGADGESPLRAAHGPRRSALAGVLIEAGALVNILNGDGVSPLQVACASPFSYFRCAIPALLRASSRETRRAVSTNGWSALDCLLGRDDTSGPWFQDVIAELLLSGTPVRPSNAPRALTLAARLAAPLAPRAAAHELRPPPWQAHEAMVQLAFDLQEMREVDEGVRAREARVAELERTLAEAGIDSSSSSSESGDEGDEGDDDEK